MRRGKILDNLAKLSGPPRPVEVEEPTDVNPLEVESSHSASRGTGRRGRGAALLSRLEALSVRSQADPRTVGHEAQATHHNGSGDTPRTLQARSAKAPSSSSSDRHSEDEAVSSPRPLSRQGSDISRSSVVSQQFAVVEETNYKAPASLKTPTASGQPVKLSVNYMTFTTKEGQQVEEYHVDYNPNIESTQLRYRLLRTEQARAIVGNVIHWTGTNLYLPIKLDNKVTVFEANHPVTNTPVKVRLTFIKTPPVEELLPFYNSLMHKVMTRLKYVIINRQHYSPIHKIAIEQHRLEVWPGWITSIQKLDGGIKLSVDASFRVLRLDTVRDILIEIRNNSRNVNLKEAFEAQLIGSIIMTKYNNRAYRIDGIDLTTKPSDKFLQDKTNEEISYVDYMRTHYNVEVKDTQQPMIISRPKPKKGEENQEPKLIYLIPELCFTTGLTDDMRANYNIMKAIDVHTKLPPNARESKYTEFLQQISTDERAKSVFEDWNLSVKPHLDLVEGRRLETETVVFGNERSHKVQDNVDWTRAATTGPMLKGVNIENWVLMHTERDANFAQDLMDSFREVSKSMGIVFSKPRIVKLPNDAPITYAQHGKREVKRTDQMVVIMTPGKSQREDRYNTCKRLFSCELPVPCQFVRCGTISNPRKIRAICQKIVIQIVSKVGGQPWGMKFPLKSFMVIGMDVYHDTCERKNSCVGFVASMNQFTSAWYSHTFFQNSLEEIGQKLSVSMINAIKRFHENNGYIPERIIVYRDGVGDGQMATVLELEVTQAMNAIKFYMRDCHAQSTVPQLSYIIVQKRINTKLSRRYGNEITNPLPGTFLDHTITHPEYNDFYLVSQHVNQGTVSPTKYVVLTETGTLKLEHHQKLAYKMTHMYYNWCGTVRVPAPCQYAHKLAYLTGQNIRAQASEKLEDKLYFL